LPIITIKILDAPAARPAQALGLLVPKAISTAHQSFVNLEITGADQRQAVSETSSNQGAMLVTDLSDEPVLTYTFTQTGLADDPGDYAQFDNRYTRASPHLCDTIVELMDNDQGVTAQRIVSHTASLFDYGHPDEKFNDGHDDVPVIACGVAKGSCVDINTYLVSAFNAAGIPAVYFAGYFFPEERGGITNDMHCWVATWINGAWQEWDIAHHKKLGIGADDIQAGYNPKPGRRFAITYGRGLTYDLDTTQMVVSHLSEPKWVFADGATQTARIEARLTD